MKKVEVIKGEGLLNGRRNGVNAKLDSAIIAR